MPSETLSELLSHCIRCGFCLEACPTFVATGSELESPRGRIYLVRSAEEGRLKWVEDVKPHLDQCLGCRACETSCPSGVHYGAILELARDKVEAQSPNRAKKALLEITTRPSLLKLQLGAGRWFLHGKIPEFLSTLIAGAPPEADLPSPQRYLALPPLRESQLPPVKGEVYFLEGCAMRVLYPRVHECSKRLLRRAGYLIREVNQGCCGALHAHNGYPKEAKEMARKTEHAFSDSLPVIVDSAGCGSTMKEYEDSSFSDRVFDLSEFLSNEGFVALLAESQGLEWRAAYHEACHLVHGQRISSQPKELLKSIPGLTLEDLPEADMCCGSAGIYNVTQPQMARQLLERKWTNIEHVEPDVLATANPGCHAWIAQARREHRRSIRIMHVAELLEASFIGMEAFGS